MLHWSLSHLHLVVHHDEVDLIPDAEAGDKAVWVPQELLPARRSPVVRLDVTPAQGEHGDSTSAPISARLASPAPSPRLLTHPMKERNMLLIRDVLPWPASPATWETTRGVCHASQPSEFAADLPIGHGPLPHHDLEVFVYPNSLRSRDGLPGQLPGFVVSPEL